MRGNKSLFRKILVIIAIGFIFSIAAFAYFSQKPANTNTEKPQVSQDTNGRENTSDNSSQPADSKSETKTAEGQQTTQTDDQKVVSGQKPASTQLPVRTIINNLAKIIAKPQISESASSNKPATSKTIPDDNATYTIKYITANKQVVAAKTLHGKLNEQVTIEAEDLFDKGYELLDQDIKSLTLAAKTNEVVFQVGKSREQMPLEEFLKYEVNYKYPLKYRNLNFANRQKELEDFVVKKVYQHETETGVFYGTEDQAEQIRRTMLNSSYQGAYFRYATDIKPMPPKPTKNGLYELNIEFTYKEWPENIEEGEAAITKFYEKYKDRVKTDAEKAKLIQDWILKNVKSRMPSDKEPNFPWVNNSKGQRRIHFPASAMLDGEGVCLTYAMTFARLAERFGLDVRVIQGASISGGENDKASAERVAKYQEKLNNPDTTTYNVSFFNHSWNLVKINGNWHHVDIYHDLNLAQNFNLTDKHQFFLQSDDFVKKVSIEYKIGRRTKKHNIYKIWNKNRIPAAPTSQNSAKTLPDLTD